MTVTRRTLSLPRELAKQIEKIARREKMSFSAAVTMLAEEAIRGRRDVEKLFTSMGSGASGLPDLGTNHEKYIEEIFREEYDD